MDVLASGPERRPRQGRNRLGRVRGLVLGDDAAVSSTARRRVRSAMAVLLGIGAVLALRVAAEPVVPREGAARTVNQPAPPPEAGMAVPLPPFDRLPGRTPIPAPTMGPDRQVVRGPLPAVGGPHRKAALASAELVLGRFCRQPAEYAVEAAPEPDWERVTAHVHSRERSAGRPAIVLRLAWTGRAYAWSGSRRQLSNC